VQVEAWLSPSGAITQSRLAEEEPVEIRAMNLGMTSRTGTLVKGPGRLVMEERGVAMAFQTEHAFFAPFQEKLIRRAVRHVTARAPLDATGQMFKGKRAPFLDMAPRAGLIVHAPQRNTTRAAMRRMAVRALHGTLQDLVVHGQGKRTADLLVTAKAEIRRLLPQEMHGHGREMRRMTVVTGDPGQLMLTAPELKLLRFFLVTGEAGRSTRLG
jgi:hypothetical protein